MAKETDKQAPPEKPPENMVQWRVKEWFPQLTEQQQADLKKYHAELIKFNAVLNLISAKTMPISDNVHFADCLLGAKMLEKKSVDTIYDFGSGNGFPGLIFAMMFPKWQVKLVEIDVRKSEFLKHMISNLKLLNAEVLLKSVEELPEKSVGFAVSRGFAGLSKSLIIARRCFRKGGVYFHMKSEEWLSEVASLPSQLCTLWEPSLIGDYRLPVGEIQYSIIQTKKLND